MSIKEKVAYLKGLAEGLGLNQESSVEKLISVIIDTLSDIADEIEELNENALDIGEELDAISDDLADVEEFLFDDDFDDDEFDDFGDFDEEDEDEEDGCAFCDDGSFSYEVDCPSCGDKIVLSESDLMRDSITCLSCGEELEFDFDEGEEEVEIGEEEAKQE